MIRRKAPRTPAVLALGLACALTGRSVAVPEHPPAAVPAAEPPAVAPHPIADRPAVYERTDGSQGAAPGPGGPHVPAAVGTDEIQGLLKLGAALSERGEYDSAEIAFRQVMNAPGVPEEDLKTALLGLARMHRRQGAHTKAVAILERYLKDYPGDDRSPEVLLDLGRTLRALGIHRLAIARFFSVLNSTLKLTGSDFEHYQRLTKTAQFEIAQTHFEAGSFAEANKYFTRLRLLDLAPADRARAHFMAAYSLRLQGDREAAITNLRAFIEQSPGDENIPEARHLLATTLRELGRSQEALAATLDLLRMESRTAADPKRWAFWQRRTGNQLANEYFEAGDTLNARTIYSALVELANEPAWRLPLLYQIALCDERLGLVDRARDSYRKIGETAGAAPPPELAELVHMAAWRLDHLDWREQLGQQVGSFFTPPPDPASDPTPAAPTPAATTP